MARAYGGYALLAVAYPGLRQGLEGRSDCRRWTVPGGLVADREIREIR